MQDIPLIKHLTIQVSQLDDAMKAFESCKNLENLFLLGNNKDSAFTKKFLPCIKNIKRLHFNALELDDDFRLCKKLTSLVLLGENQTKIFEDKLLAQPSSIKFLTVNMQKKPT